MPRPFALETLVVVLAAAILAATPLTLPIAADEPIRGAAGVAPVACCGGDEADAEPEQGDQSLVVQNDPSEPSANKSGGPPVDLTRTVANRNRKAGGPDAEEKWHVWVTKRKDAPTSGRFEKIVVHVEPYSRDDCGEGSAGNRQCAKATIWLYKAITEAENAPYKLELEERYREIPLSVVKTTGPTRGLAFRADEPRTKASGTVCKGETRTFLITGARKGNGNSRNHRTLRVTTFVKSSGSPKAASVGDPKNTATTECIDYVDDAYYDEEYYEDDYMGETDYVYEEPPVDDSPYEEQPYDYEE